jgi:hypothetical protein
MSWAAAAFDMLCAFQVLARMTVLFRLRGARAVARATGRAMEIVPTEESDLLSSKVDLWRTYRAFIRIKRLWPGDVTCLQTAVALQEVLRKRGIAGAVRVGTRREGGQLQAHAWVEVGVYVLDDARLHPNFLAFGQQAVEKDLAGT